MRDVEDAIEAQRSEVRRATETFNAQWIGRDLAESCREVAEGWQRGGNSCSGWGQRALGGRPFPSALAVPGTGKGGARGGAAEGRT